MTSSPSRPLTRRSLWTTSVAWALTALALLAAPAFAADPPGQTYILGPFDSLHFAGSANVRYAQGERDEVFIEGDARLLETVEVQLRDGRLTVSQQGGWKFWRSQRLQVRVMSRELRGVVISGAADFIATEPVQCKDLEVSISGAGLARFEQLKAEHLKFSVSGSGDGHFAGSTQDLNVRISGRGDFLAPRLHAQVARISISGLGRAKVWATDELNASLSGVGSIDYWGNPPKGQRRLAGLGSLQNQGEKPPER